eukprot:TRINITY_DN25623_c0_g1_i1.p1 TRINITY_DN25623_c0_g1~~TRINITY_DN25623_c0_g1_i1.p1  ORF type:complete len:409 (-),score=90.13 TRINITY_DN25623_c0_g1_i1:104-1330(-)
MRPRNVNLETIQGMQKIHEHAQLSELVKEFHSEADGFERKNVLTHMTIQRARLEADRFEKQPLMGCAWRSPITGQITLRDYNFPDFHLVDLWTRPQLVGTPEELAEDVYIFRARPMAYRTWIYHHMYREKVVIPESKDDETSIENRLLKHVLMQRCIDKPILAGRWSPLVASVPASLAACFTSDIPLMVAAIFVCVLLYLSSIKIAEPRWYRVSRLASLAPRLGFCIFLAIRVPAVLENFNIFALFGVIVIFVCVVADLYYGDVISVRDYRYTCMYDIVKTLPNRVFVVRQTGGMIGFEDKKSYSRDQRLTIMGSLDNSLKLVADIEGLLVQLDPINKATVRKLQLQIEDAALSEFSDSNVQMPKFLGMDVFGPDMKSVRDIEQAEAQKDLLMILRQKTSNADDIHPM